MESEYRFHHIFFGIIFLEKEVRTTRVEELKRQEQRVVKLEKDFSFEKEYPSEWELISKKEGQVTTDKGLITGKTKKRLVIFNDLLNVSFSCFISLKARHVKYS